MEALGSYLRLDTPRPGDLPGLTALRGLAVLLVLLRHAAWPFWSSDGLAAVAGFDIGVVFVNGWIGVDLFFVLSGFLIAHHLMRAEAAGRRFELAPYLTRRFFRIAPLYYVVLALVAAGAIPFYRVGEEALGARILWHLAFLQDYLGSDIVVAFWSLGVEEKFYLLAPVLVGVAIGVRRAAARLAICAALIVGVVLSRGLAAHGLPSEIAYSELLKTFRFPFHHCLDGLAVGMACAIALPALQARWSPGQAARAGERLIRLGLAGVLAWLAGGELLSRIGRWDQVVQPTALALTFGVLVLGCALGGRTGLALDRTSLRGLGQISYSAYLIHMPLIPLACLLAGAIPGRGPEGFWTFLPAFLTLSLAAALVLHFAVEKPFLRLKDRIGSPSRGGLRPSGSARSARPSGPAPSHPG